MSGRGAPREKLSVCVLACNEERVLERCLASIAWADEIVVVVDAKSRDRSEDVAKRLASRVETRPYAGDVEQKRYAVSLAGNDWVFILDPDEVVTPELGAAMQAALERAAASPDTKAPIGSPDPSGAPGAPVASTPPDAYRVNRATWHLGRWIRHGDFYPDWKLRLFRRSRARFVGRDPHGRVEVEGNVAKLEGELLHYSYRDLADQIARIQFFSGEAAAALAREGARFRLHQLVFHPPARFLRSYVLRAGFRDGMPGFVIAVASAFYVFLKYAKLWEATRVAAIAPASPPRIPPGTPRA